MKKLLLVSVLGSLIISSSAFASEGKKDFTFTSFSSNSFSTTVSSSLNTTSTTDLSFAFDDIDSLNIVAMNDEEMDKTEGAFANFVAGGAVGGGTSIIGYTVRVATTDEEFSFKGLAKEVAFGATMGAVTGATGNPSLGVMAGAAAKSLFD